MASVQATLVGHDTEVADYFGEAIALEGNTLLVGAPGADRVGDNPVGAVYVFTRSGTIWTEQQRLTATGQPLRFGCAVALDGDLALIGAEGTSVPVESGGAAYVFARDTGGWVEQQKLVPRDLSRLAQFGHAVAIDGSDLLIGASDQDNGDLTIGAAYLFAPAATPGAACTWTSECQSGFCVDGVCCDASCGDGLLDDCQACSVAAGAVTDGTCGPVVDGTICDGGTCAGGVCRAGPDAGSGTGTKGGDGGCGCRAMGAQVRPLAATAWLAIVLIALLRRRKTGPPSR